MSFFKKIFNRQLLNEKPKGEKKEHEVSIPRVFEMKDGTRRVEINGSLFKASQEQVEQARQAGRLQKWEDFLLNQETKKAEKNKENKE